MITDCVKIFLYDKVEAKIVGNSEGTYINSSGKEAKGNYLEITYNFKDKTYYSHISINEFRKDYYNDKDTQIIYVNKDYPEKYIYFNVLAFIGLACQVGILFCVYLRYHNLNKKLQELKS